MRLLAEVACIHQKQDAFGPAKFEQAIDRGDGGEGFAGAGGHMNQGAGLVQGQRLFQAGDGTYLAVTQVAHQERRHLLCQAAAQGVGLSQPGRQLFRLEEMENFS